MHKQVTCKLWDREDVDQPGIAKSSDGKRRLIAPAFAETATADNPASAESAKAGKP